VEHDAEDIWRVTLDTVGEVSARLRAAGEEVAAIGITNQRETTVLWDRRTGQPVHNAIVWQDRRTAQFCDQLRRDGHAQKFQEKTGLVIDAYLSGSKLRWLLDNVPGLRERAARIGQVIPGMAGDSPDEVLERLRQRFFVGTPAEIVAQMRPFSEAGVSLFMLQHFILDDPDALDLLASEVMTELQSM